MTLYKEKYYIYWGPVPALILTAIYPFYDKRVGDLFLTFIFVCGIFLLQTRLLLVLWNFYFGDLSKQIFGVSIFLIGLSGHLMLLRHNFESAAIYEAAIASGQFFLFGGLLTAWTAATKPSVSIWMIALTGFLWALAIGSRNILAAPVGFMTLVLAFWLLKNNNGSLPQTTRLLIPLATSLLFGLACLGWYNWARFGSVTETGLYYQLAGFNIQKHYGELFSPSYIFQNLYNYLFNAIGFTSKFPFVFMRMGSETPIFSFYTLPNTYVAQPVAGLFYAFPFALFAVAPFFAFIFKRKLTASFQNTDAQTRLTWLTLSLSGSFFIVFGLLTAYFWSGMRFVGDFMPSLTTLSVIGFWQGCRFLRDKPSVKKIYVIVGATLASASILVGSFLALSTNSGLVKNIINRFPFLS